MTDNLGRAERHAIEIQALAGQVVADLPGALRMLREWKRGYPTGGDTTGDGSSRTEALALAGPDAVDRDQRDLVHSLEAALRAIRVAYNIGARYRPPRKDRKPGPPTAPSDDGWCSSCQRDGGHLEPVWDGRYRNLCRWCAEFTAAEGCEPPLSLLRLRHQGKRITADMVTQALARVGRRAS